MVAILSFGLILAGCNSSSGGEESSNGSSDTGNSDGDKKNQFDGKKLNVAVFEGGYGGKFWKQLAKNFEEDYPGTTINVTSSPDIGKKIRPKMNAGNPPDVVYLNQTNPSGVTQAMIKNRQLTDLSDVFNKKALNSDKPLKDKIISGLLDTEFASPYGDDKIYFAPYNYNVMGLWYNKNLFNENDIQPPKTWDQFFALNEKAKKQDRALYTFQGSSNPGYLEEIIVPAIYADGGQEALDQFYHFDPEFWKSDTAKKVLGMIEKIATKDNMLMDGTLGMDFTQAQTAFLQGKAMFIQNGNWFIDEMKDAPKEEGFKYGFLGVPPYKKGEKMNTMVSMEQLYIPKKAENKKLAKEFLRYMYTDKSVKLNGKTAHAVMAVQGAADMVKDNINKNTYEVFKKVEDNMQTVGGTYKPLPQGTNLNPRKTFYNQAVSVMNNNTTAKEWRNKMYEVYKKADKALEDAQ